MEYAITTLLLFAFVGYLIFKAQPRPIEPGPIVRPVMFTDPWEHRVEIHELRKENARGRAQLASKCK